MAGRVVTFDDGIYCVRAEQRMADAVELSGHNDNQSYGGEVVEVLIIRSNITIHGWCERRWNNDYY